MAERNKFNMFNPEFFSESLNKTVLGQEKKSLEFFLKKFYETLIHKTKTDSTTLKQLNPLNILKKDFSVYLQDLINIEAFNHEIVNKFQNADENFPNENADVDMLDAEIELNNNFNKSNKNANRSFDIKNRKSINNQLGNFGNRININMNNSSMLNNNNNPRVLNAGLLNRKNNISSNLNRNTIPNNKKYDFLNKISNDNDMNNNNNNSNSYINLPANREAEDKKERIINLEDEYHSCCGEEEDDNDCVEQILDKANNVDPEMVIKNSTKTNILKDKNVSPKINKQMEIKIKTGNDETDINKIRASFNLSEKPTNLQNKLNNNHNPLQYDLNNNNNFKSTNSSILSFMKQVNKNQKHEAKIKGTLFNDEKSDISEKNIGNKLVINEHGKRKNLSNHEENANKLKKKKPTFK